MIERSFRILAVQVLAVSIIIFSLSQIFFWHSHFSIVLFKEEDLTLPLEIHQTSIDVQKIEEQLLYSALAEQAEREKTWIEEHMVLDRYLEETASFILVDVYKNELAALDIYSLIKAQREINVRLSDKEDSWQLEVQ